MKFILDFFKHMLNTQKREKIKVFFKCISILQQIIAIIEELALSKYFLTLCYK